MSRKVYIYSLEYPEGNVRYIGQTIDLKARFSQHLRDKSTTHKTCWIKSLKALGQKPVMNIVDIVDEESWSFWEVHYISLYSSFGFDLTNSSFGGEGMFATEETKKKQIENCSRRKPIYQFDLNGSFIKEWGCSYYAEKELKINNTGISHVCNNDFRTYKDFIWLWKADCEQNPNLIQDRLKALEVPLSDLNPNKRVVCQYTIEGNLIQEWDSSKKIKDILGYDMGGIAKCCRNEQKTCNGFIWKYKDGDADKKFSFAMSEERKGKISKEKFELHGGKPILQYSLQGELLKRWDCSACNIAKELGMYKNADTLIRASLKGTSNCAKGFIWIYEESLEQNPNIIQERINKSRRLGKANRLWQKYP